MRGDIGIVSLRHAGDETYFGDSAGVAQVRLQDGRGLLLQHFAKAPFGEDALAGGYRQMGTARDLCHDVVVLRLAGLFDEHRVIGLVSLDQQLRSGGADGTVEVDGNVDLFAHCLPKTGEHFGRILHIGFREDVAVAARLLLGDARLEGAEALLLQLLHLVGLTGVSINANAVTQRATEQFVDGYPESLAL